MKTLILVRVASEKKEAYSEKCVFLAPNGDCSMTHMSPPDFPSPVYCGKTHHWEFAKLVPDGALNGGSK
jgi:hypothetical protein